MATKLKQDDIVQRAVDGALADIKKYAPHEFEDLLSDPVKKEALVHAARKAAEEEVNLAKEFSAGPCDDIEARLLKHLPKHRVDLIKTGLEVPTYRLDIQKTHESARPQVNITRDGKPFLMESIELNSAAAFAKASWIQIASIVVEAILLVLQAVGIKVAVSKQAIAKTAEEIIPVIESSSQIQKAVQALEEAAKGGSKLEIAKAIFYLIKDSYSASILWKIIKGLCSNMSKWDWIKTAGIVTAMIIAAFATDGLALIAKIVLALNSAYEFMKKLTNLQDMKLLEEKL